MFLLIVIKLDISNINGNAYLFGRKLALQDGARREEGEARRAFCENSRVGPREPARHCSRYLWA